jgi:hypothetical protein
VRRCRSGTGRRDHTPPADQVREAAQRFVQDSVSGFSADRQPEGQEAVDRLGRDARRLPRGRVVEASRACAPTVTVGLLRRTGAVVHLSAARRTADAASFPAGAEDTIAAAPAALGDDHRPTTVAGDTWHAGRWTIMIEATDEGSGRESGDGSAYRFHGDGLGMVYDTGKDRAKAVPHHHQPNPCAFTPNGVSPAACHKNISGSSRVGIVAHRNWSGFL